MFAPSENMCPHIFRGLDLRKNMIFALIPPPITNVKIILDCRYNNMSNMSENNETLELIQGFGFIKLWHAEQIRSLSAR